MKRKLLKGTLMLTTAGLLSRLIGFFYKIFLAKTMGSELMGIYQLIFPVFGICVTIFSSGIQTAISKLVAEYGDASRKRRTVFVQAICTSITFSILLMLVVSNFSGFIAEKIINEAKTAAGIKILGISFPFCAITSCINGYFYGIKKPCFPAITQLIEQIARVSAVCLLTCFFSDNFSTTCEMAVIGIVVGEIVSCVINIFGLTKEMAANRHRINLRSNHLKANAFSNRDLETDDLKNKDFKKIDFKNHNFENSDFKNNISTKTYKQTGSRRIYLDFSGMYIPLTINRLVLTLLHSYETILLPVLLVRFGYSHSEAVSTLGVLTGMSLPFLVFPTAITSAISILLLPTISEAHAGGDFNICIRLTGKVLKYSLILGFYCLGIFSLSGRELCELVFDNPDAGNYLYILAFLCPLMYMSAAIPSIINGIGKPMITFRNSCIISIMQIAMLAVLVTTQGLNGYFISMFLMQFIQGYIDLSSLYKEKLLNLSAIEGVIKPGLPLVILIPVSRLVLKKMWQAYSLPLGLVIGGLVFTLAYGIVLIGTRCVRVRDFI